MNIVRYAFPAIDGFPIRAGWRVAMAGTHR